MKRELKNQTDALKINWCSGRQSEVVSKLLNAWKYPSQFVAHWQFWVFPLSVIIAEKNKERVPFKQQQHT